MRLDHAGLHVTDLERSIADLCRSGVLSRALATELSGIVAL
jgi:hypothetical protein